MIQHVFHSFVLIVMSFTRGSWRCFSEELDLNLPSHWRTIVSKRLNNNTFLYTAVTSKHVNYSWHLPCFIHWVHIQMTQSKELMLQLKLILLPGQHVLTSDHTSTALPLPPLIVQSCQKLTKLSFLWMHFFCLLISSLLSNMVFSELGSSGLILVWKRCLFGLFAVT